MVTLEAMALALPAVILHHGVYKDLIPQDCALKVSPTQRSATISALAEAIVSLAEDHELRLSIGSTGRQYVQKHCTLSAQQNALLRIYERRTTRTLTD